ncbi:MAG: multicopper oxidase domain-containing protein [Gemmatimonas sp.]
MTRTQRRVVSALAGIAGVATVAALVSPTARRAMTDASLPVAVANDNRASAGTRRGDTVVVRLVARIATWYPEDSAGPHADVLTLGEEGRAMQIPAPLLRVPTGTVLDVTIRNALVDSVLWVHGLGTRPMRSRDSVRIVPGDSARFVFGAGAPGTYSYAVWPGNVDRVNLERETATGAFVVDSIGARTDDRVFVMNVWGQPVDSLTYRNALAINGKSWPYTERIRATTGDTLRWRVVNGSLRNHPMHLHGFYFRLESKGDGYIDGIVPDAPSLVTEMMFPASTMRMSWVPEREGNWLFHCHIAFHVTPEARLDGHASAQHVASHDPNQHMAGLILGIEVSRSATETDESRNNLRRMRLFVQEGTPRSRSKRALGFVVQNGSRAPVKDSVNGPGTPLVLHVGEPTDITVVNRLREATAIHWHGIELESYSDGVAGWSGNAKRTAPVIAPGDSFVARLTLRRAGTFMYHTHLNDMEQLTSGLYGGIVVLPRGQRFDSATDHLFVGGWDGTADPPHLLINGDSIPRPLTVAAGLRHRFRFVNIGAAATIRPIMMRDSVPVAWQLVAQDGADLRTPRTLTRPADALRVDVGQTADFTWLPPAPGRYRLSFASAGRPNYIQIPVIVR